MWEKLYKLPRISLLCKWCAIACSSIFSRDHLWFFDVHRSFCIAADTRCCFFAFLLARSWRIAFVFVYCDAGSMEYNMDASTPHFIRTSNLRPSASCHKTWLLSPHFFAKISGFVLNCLKISSSLGSASGSSRIARISAIRSRQLMYGAVSFPRCTARMFVIAWSASCTRSTTGMNRRP